MCSKVCDRAWRELELQSVFAMSLFKLKPGEQPPMWPPVSYLYTTGKHFLFIMSFESHYFTVSSSGWEGGVECCV